MSPRPASIALKPLAATFTFAFLLAGCGGGGGGGGTVSAPPPLASAPTPAPAPAPPAPTPAPAATPAPTQSGGAGAALQVLAVPAQYDTPEFRQSSGPSQHNAAVPWNAGHTGKGVTIAVVDSGVDTHHPEFAGRLAAASRDMYANRAASEGMSDHGTRVAQVAAGARDGKGVLGMAWNASILALRTDQPGSCGGSGGAASGCLFTDDGIAKAVLYAAENGAKVINISLGGGSAGAVLSDAVRTATAKGALVVVAAGNDGLAEGSGFTTRLAAAGGGGVLVVGAIDDKGQMTDFSNRAGLNTGGYIAARGQTVCCVYEGGELRNEGGFLTAFSGTSFAAPQVAGAAALLAQAFPHLTGEKLAAILVQSAFDAGEAGPDAIYGSGVLDLARAFQPLGKTALAGQATAFTPGEAVGTASGPMGDALASVSLPVLITDSFDRAFSADVGASFKAARIGRALAGAVSLETRQVIAGSPRARVALTLTDPDFAPAALLGREDGMTGKPGDSPDLLGARAALTLAGGTTLGLAYRVAADDLAVTLRGESGPAFLIADNPAGVSEALHKVDLAFALRHRLGSWGTTVSAGSGHAPALSEEVGTAEFAADRRDRVHTMGFALDRVFGPLETVLGLSWTGEEGTLLGARLHQAFGLAGADTFFLDAQTAWHPAPGWRLGGSLRHARTSARAGGLVSGATRLTSQAFAFDVARSDALTHGDTLALRLSQPLRVTGGSLALSLPQGWDYATLSADYATRHLSLAPQGRELATELAWSGPLFAGQAMASLFYRADPGHRGDLPADKGVALRWSRGF